MALPQPHHPQEAPAADGRGADGTNLLRWAIWVAIGALILAALVCVVWVLVGPDNGLIGRAFLTILLLAGFAGVAILDAHLSARRPAWFVLTSMVVWVVTLLLGAFLIWMPEGDGYGLGGVGRFMSFLLIVLVLQLAVLHVRLYAGAHLRHRTGFTRAITYVTVGLVAVLAVMLVLPLTFWEFIDFGDLYWRFVVAVTILAAVGTALVPLINALFAPRRPRAAQPVPGGYAPAPWPTYADGMTPLPVLPDGSPDWNAYYTGYPTYPQGYPPVQGQVSASPSEQPAAGGQPPAAYPPAPADAAQQPYPPTGAPQHVNAAPPPSPQQPAPPYPAQPPAPTGYQGYPPPPPPPH
jgi:hypothetical protein